MFAACASTQDIKCNFEIIEVRWINGKIYPKNIVNCAVLEVQDYAYKVLLAQHPTKNNILGRSGSQKNTCINMIFRL